MKIKISKYILTAFALLLLATSFNSCRKENFYSGSNSILTFSEDTLRFDTVFTQMGTVTRYFKIENKTNTTVLLDKLNLRNLDGLNTFRINVDGTSGTQFTNVEVPAKDYIYVFVEATVDPNNITNPFIILDEISYEYGDVRQTSYLSVWGQNAHYHVGKIYSSQTITWTNDLPHVILRNDTFPGVGVDSFSVLNIEPGCKIYVAQGAGLFVDGKLFIGNSSSQDSVIFRSNRIETLQNGVDFETNPGLWQGIALFSGSKAEIYNTTISQAIWGIQARHYSEEITDMINDAGRPDILLDKVKIKNSALNALVAVNAKLVVKNSMFYNSGNVTVAIGLGGDVNFDNCTMYNNGVSGSNANKVLVLSNYAQTSSGTGVNDLEAANFTNCIIYGADAEKMAFSKDDQAIFNNSFKNCLLKTELVTETTFTDCILNEDPKFENASNGNFNLRENSPCIATGFNNGILQDIYFKTRTHFDIGAVAY